MSDFFCDIDKGFRVKSIFYDFFDGYGVVRCIFGGFDDNVVVGCKSISEIVEVEYVWEVKGFNNEDEFYRSMMDVVIYRLCLERYCDDRFIFKLFFCIIN